MYEIGYLWYDEEDDRDRYFVIDFDSFGDMVNWWLMNVDDDYIFIVYMIELED